MPTGNQELVVLAAKPSSTTRHPNPPTRRRLDVRWCSVSDTTAICIFSDLGINGLITLNKNAFLMLSHLTELDLFDNELDHLPDGIFDDLGSLQYL
jgi:hypothetical protein